VRLVSGGENVYPIDIEAVIAMHPAVSEMAIIGIPDEKWAETPLALVVLQPHVRMAADALRQWANERLGAYQRVAAETLPGNQLGKLLKRELREAFWQPVAPAKTTPPAFPSEERRSRHDA
jgi:acyl-CoA synthetase (AMP-forming)/AMP-acid ligase II